MTYRHTQRGTLIVASCLVAGAVGVLPLWRTGLWPPALALTVVMLAVAILFSSLTVEVADSELRWYFGP